MLEKSSTRPVALPCASCAWNTSLRAGAGGPGTPSPDLSPSTRRAASLDLAAFFFPRSPSGILQVGWRGPPALPRQLPSFAPRTLHSGPRLRAGDSGCWTNGSSASAWLHRLQAPSLWGTEHLSRAASRSWCGSGGRKAGHCRSAPFQPQASE